MTTTKKLCKEKTGKNMKRLCKTYGQISKDFYTKTRPNFYRKTIPISKIILLGCGTGLWDRN